MAEDAAPLTLPANQAKYWFRGPGKEPSLMSTVVHIDDPIALTLWPLEPDLLPTTFCRCGEGWARLDLVRGDGTGPLPELARSVYLGLLLLACEDPRPVLAIERRAFAEYDDFMLGEVFALLCGLTLRAATGAESYEGPLVEQARLLPGGIEIGWGRVTAAAIVRDEFRWAVLKAMLRG